MRLACLQYSIFLKIRASASHSGDPGTLLASNGPRVKHLVGASLWFHSTAVYTYIRAVHGNIKKVRQFHSRGRLMRSDLATASTLVG
jgi:hypothetical protein